MSGPLMGTARQYVRHLERKKGQQERDLSERVKSTMRHRNWEERGAFLIPALRKTSR